MDRDSFLLKTFLGGLAGRKRSHALTRPVSSLSPALNTWLRCLPFSFLNTALSSELVGGALLFPHFYGPRLSLSFYLIIIFY